MIDDSVKDKANELLIENWFIAYEKLTGLAKYAAIEDCNYMIITDVENADFWREVKKELISL